MPIGMAAQFMTAAGDFPHESRITLGHPSENEVGATHTALLEEVEDATGVRLDAAGVTLPVRSIVYTSKGFHVKVVLDIHGNHTLENHTGAAKTRRINYPMGSAFSGRFRVTASRRDPAAIGR